MSNGNGYKLAEVISRRDDFLDFITFCIENSLDVDICYQKLLSKIKEYTQKISSWDKSKIEKLLKNKKEYKDKWEEFLIQDDINDAINETKSSAQYCWSRSRANISPEEWYKNYWVVLKKLDFSNINKSHDSYDNTTYISSIVLLAKLDKLDELGNINYVFIGRGNLRLFAKIISDKAITNRKRTWMKLDIDQRKKIFIWLDNIVSDYMDNNPEKRKSVSKEMAISWYIFDKEKLWNYINYVKKLRNNYDYVGRGDIKRFKTVRLFEISSLLKYLAEESKFDDLEKILSEFKLGKTELINSQNIRRSIDLYYTGGENDEIFCSEEERRKREKKFQEILNKYLSIIKESFILKWEQFKIK